MNATVAGRFASDIAASTGTRPDGTTWTIRRHEMTVLHEDGLYRHLRFRSPDTGSYWFDVITWPGNLVINGDCGTFAFARLEDMFGFFRGSRVNPQYWAEKVRGETRTRNYSEERFRQQVKEAAAEAEKECPGLTAAIEERFYGFLAEWDTTYEDGARRALEEFTFYKDEGDRYRAGKEADFRFCDTFEWDLTDWDWWFLWCLHGIQWGVAQYDAHRHALHAAALAEDADREQRVAVTA